MTYSSIIYGLLTRIWQLTSMIIQLLVANNPTMPTPKKYFNGLLQEGHILKFHDYFSS